MLTERGVRIQTSEQATALGNAVADIARALGMVDESAVVTSGGERRIAALTPTGD